ncbi:MAG: hypothetical protein A3F68_07260 [Acidobacteria bacterium RIFCSPLOWO2_12_FULL_54_10]|nr:MAG: hypothetical protein A3F68_07260 [Acidobacteria bacterium RIFCSPLOWO2_12_FULL_54_10]
MTKYRAAILTVSDSVCAGSRVDRSGPAVAEVLEKNGWEIAERTAVPDEMTAITSALWELCSRSPALIVTVGGTGLAERDVTPEATRAVITREITGLAEQMRRVGTNSTPRAILSRALAGISGKTIILNLPGSPKGAVESLLSVIGVLEHAADLIAGDTQHPENSG